MSSLSKRSYTFLPLFLVLVIDAMGMGLILPVLTVLFLDPTTNMVAANTSLLLRNFLYGSALMSFFLCMFFGAPILGDLSDKYGRKKILLLCLVLTGLSYIISAIGIHLESVLLVLVGRSVAGFMAGSMPIAQAAIADISLPDEKAKNLSYITLAGCLGFVIGPLVGGYFSQQSLASWFTTQTPFYVAAVLALLNALGLWLSFHETFFPQFNLKIKVLKGVELFLGAFRNPKIRAVSLIFLLFQFAWGLYFQFVSLYSVQTYHFSALKIGLFMGYIGLIFVFSLLKGIHFYLRFTSVSLTNHIALIFIGGGILLNALLPYEWVQWATVFIIVTHVGIAYTCQLTLFSNCVDSGSQGWIMGISAAVMAVGWVLGGLLTSVVGLLDLRVPFIIAGLILLFASFLAYKLPRS